MSVTTGVHNLSMFGLADMVACGSALRHFGQQERSMEAFAKRATQYFYENLVKENGDSACTLVRFFITQTAGHLPRHLRVLLPADLSESIQCLTLLGTAGLERTWRKRRLSSHHQVIPLPDKHMAGQSPDPLLMISHLIKQLGVNGVSDHSQQCNIFHVDDALGNSAFPAQHDFVIPYRIKSVLGFTGALPSGSLFAMIFFSTTPISRNTADLFRTIALNLRLAILRFEDGLVFGADEDADV